MNDERKFLTYEEAVAMLPDGDTCHTYRQGPLCMIGADWPRQDILNALKNGQPELAGPIATSNNHGLLLYDDRGALFVATRRPTCSPK